MILLFSLFSNNAFSNDNYKTTDFQGFKFKQELNIPVDTGREDAKFQPIDMNINFENTCWALNETVHSIRIVYEYNSDKIELESQIYELEFSDSSHISSCNIVFLIPEYANGREKYFIYYDNTAKPSPGYIDHLVVNDAHYYYEPVSGVKADFSYFSIIEDGYIAYAVTYEGELFGHGISQVVASILPNSKEIETKILDKLASYTMAYSIEGDPGYTGTSWSKNPSKSVLINGNLMVKFRIIGISPEGTIKTDNIYTYYYCPTVTKRIVVNVNHEVLKTVEISGTKIEDGTYASLLSFQVRSAIIKDLNVGQIQPKFYLYAEDDLIKEYDIPLDPDQEEEVMLLDRTDDIDLGKKAWLSIGNPLTGAAYGLIFQSNEGFYKETDGLQAKALVEQTIKLPGLEVDAEQVYVVVNAYEKGKINDYTLPKGMNVNFESEFITFAEGGYEAVDKESEIFQELSKIRPKLDQEKNQLDGEEIERYKLDSYVHFSPSFPLGNLLSIVTGKNLSYIYAELYNAENKIICSGSVSRLRLKDDIDLDHQDLPFFERIKTLIGFFDWKNSSLFKKISFPSIQQDKYVVKIYRENSILSDERQFIGIGFVELYEDRSINIFCRPEGSMKLSIMNQNNEGVENVEFQLLKDDIVIANTFSDKNGEATLKAPCYPTKPYVLKVFYNGFLVKKETITLGLKNRIFPLKKSFSISNYNLNIQLKDTWGFVPAIDVNPILTSTDMAIPVVISPEKINNGQYQFNNLYSADYQLKMNYKSFNLEENIVLSADKKLDLIFPAEFLLNFNLMDIYGNSIEEGFLKFSRGGKSEKIDIRQDEFTSISLPPGEYDLEIKNNNDIIAKQKINVRSNKNINIVTNEESFIRNILVYSVIVLIALTIIIMIWKKQIIFGLKPLVILFLIISLISPWWVLNGDNEQIMTSTNTYLLPSNIVTLTSSSEVIGGELGIVPSEVTTVLNLLSVLLIISCIVIGISIVLKNKLEGLSKLFLIASILILIASIATFLYTLSEIAKVSVGAVIGSGNLEITIPGIAVKEIILCNWGLGIGFYFTLISLIILMLLPLKNRFK